MSHRYVEWKPREKGGGFVASHHADDPITKTTRRDDRGNEVLPTGNMLVNTYQFFVILLTEEGPQRCMIAMSSSQVTTAKKWNTTINSQTGRGANGNLYTMPIFSSVYQLSSVSQQNDKGSWFGWKVQREGVVTDKDIISLAVDFSKAIRAGEVQVKEDEGNEHTSTARSETDILADQVL
jgi:hypothetical protein